VKKDLFLGYFSQGYSLFCAILFTPILLYKFGAVEFAAIGYFYLALSIFLLLEGGLVQSLSKFVAKRGEENQRVKARTFIQFLYLYISLIIMAGGFASGTILLSEGWCFKYALCADLQGNIPLFFACVCTFGARLGILPLRGVLIGGRKSYVVYYGNIVNVSFRFPLLLLATVVFPSESLISLFVFCNVASTLIEGLICALSSREIIRDLFAQEHKYSNRIGFTHEDLKFVGSISASSIVWVLYTQSDKLLLSYFADPAFFGVYTALTGIFNGILSARGPIVNALQSRVLAVFLISQPAFKIAIRQVNILLARFFGYSILFTYFFAGFFLDIWISDFASPEAIRVFQFMTIFHLFPFLLIGDYLFYLSTENMSRYLTANILSLAVILVAGLGLGAALGVTGVVMAALSSGIVSIAYVKSDPAKKFVRKRDFSQLSAEIFALLLVGLLLDQLNQFQIFLQLTQFFWVAFSVSICAVFYMQSRPYLKKLVELIEKP